MGVGKLLGPWGFQPAYSMGVRGYEHVFFYVFFFRVVFGRFGCAHGRSTNGRVTRYFFRVKGVVTLLFWGLCGFGDFHCFCFGRVVRGVFVANTLTFTGGRFGFIGVLMGVVGCDIGTFSTFGTRVVYLVFFVGRFGVFLDERGCIRCDHYVFFGGDNGGYLLTKGVAMGHAYHGSYHFSSVTGQDEFGAFFGGLLFAYHRCILWYYELFVYRFCTSVWRYCVTVDVAILCSLIGPFLRSSSSAYYFVLLVNLGVGSFLHVVQGRFWRSSFSSCYHQLLPVYSMFF